MIFESSSARTLLSVCIITLNEEENLSRCLQSISGLADQIVVVDSLSRDRTCDIAAEYRAEIWKREFPGYEKQKQFALSKATGEWVLSLDADEWIDNKLRHAIEQVLRAKRSDQITGYELNRQSYYLGVWIRHGGRSSEWKLRLVMRQYAYWTGGDPHERLEVIGRTKRLPGRLRHFPYKGLAVHLAKINKYTDMIADRPARISKTRALFGILIEPPLVFAKTYFLQAGFRDGLRGFIVAIMMAFYFFVRYAKIWEKTYMKESSDAALEELTESEF